MKHLLVIIKLEIARMLLRDLLGRKTKGYEKKKKKVKQTFKIKGICANIGIKYKYNTNKL